MTQVLTSTPASQVKLLGTVTVAGQLAWLLQDGHGNSIYDGNTWCHGVDQRSAALRHDPIRS